MRDEEFIKVKLNENTKEDIDKEIKNHKLDNTVVILFGIIFLLSLLVFSIYKNTYTSLFIRNIIPVGSTIGPK